MNKKPYRDLIIIVADKHRPTTTVHEITDLKQALTTILSAVTGHAMEGSDQTPHPDHSSVEKCSIGACFMAACSVPLIYGLREEEIAVEPEAIMHGAGTLLFRPYNATDIDTIISEGMRLFREIIEIAPKNKNLAEWIESVHNLTNRYILSGGDKEYVELLAPLYLVLLQASSSACNDSHQH